MFEDFNRQKFILRISAFYTGIRQAMLKKADLFMLYLSFFALGLVIYDLGFEKTQQVHISIVSLMRLCNILFIIIISIRYILELFERKKIFSLIAEASLLLFMIIILNIHKHNIHINPNSVLYPVLHGSIPLYLIIILVFFLELSRNTLNIRYKNTNPALLFAVSFLIIIFIGTGMLLLPKATTSSISMIDALFTSTSAVCVTGLIVVDTATKFTILGKTIILILIQVGGLGVMTFTSFFGLFFQGGSSFQNNILIKDLINEEKIADVFKTLVKIMTVTFSIELIGAVLIYTSLNTPLFHDVTNKMKFAVFHSVSAFCNAGFSTLTDNLHDYRIRFNYGLHMVVAFLIIFGGLGFPVIFNYYKLGKHYLFQKFRVIFYRKRYQHIPKIISINTRLVIITTFALLGLGTVIYFISEFNNTLSGLSFGGKLAESFFAAVTPRTAGFNTLNIANMANATIMLYLFLMWIGASPASTGGGIKTNTFALSVLNIIALARGKERTEYYRREISRESSRRASAIILISLLMIGSGIFMVSFFQPQLQLKDVVFECFSAYGTVGLSMGITSSLSAGSKMVIIMLMFLGRVGTLGILVGFVRKVQTQFYHYPTEHIMIN